MRRSFATAIAISLLWAAPAIAQIEGDFSAGGGIRIGGSTTPCTNPVQGAIRYDSGGNIMEFCDGSAWQSFGGSGLWTAGAGDDIYYNTGTPQVGIGNASPGAALDVTGIIRTSERISITGTTGLAAPVMP